MTAAPALIAAAGVGFGHAVLPDHWVPLAVVGRTRHYPLARVTRLSALAGAAHVLVSVALGAVVIVIGLQFRSRVENTQNTIVGVLLIATAVGFGLLELSGRGHRHVHSHDEGDPPASGHVHSHERSHSRLASLAAVVVPFGAAASPDLTILPVFLAASTAGAGVAVASVVVFAGVTIATIVGLTLFATVGGYRVRAPWLDRWGNLFTAVVLAVIGALVLIGAI